MVLDYITVHITIFLVPNFKSQSQYCNGPCMILSHLFSGLNMCMSGSATSCEECLLIHPSCAWCAQEVYITFYIIFSMYALCRDSVQLPQR